MTDTQLTFTVNTRALSGSALDYAVRYAQVIREVIATRPLCLIRPNDLRLRKYDQQRIDTLMERSETAPMSLADAIEIMQQETFAVFEDNGYWYASSGQCSYTRSEDGEEMMIMISEEDAIQGDDLNMAIQRCYVADVIGDTVEIPEVLFD